MRYQNTRNTAQLITCTYFNKQGQTLDSHDYIFWCGDLNYRVDLPTPVAKDYITNKHYDKLMKHDQLKKQKKLRKVKVHNTHSA